MSPVTPYNPPPYNPPSPPPACDSSPCVHGTCRPSGESFRCQCDAGYTAHGDYACAGVSCTAPARRSFSHGTVSGGGGDYPSGIAVSFSCDDGYYLIGQSTAQCGTDGSYKPLPTCSQCGSVDNCNTIVCTSNYDQQCKTAGDCDAGYTSDRNCEGECCPSNAISHAC